MKLEHLKKYINEHIALEVTEELKQKTLDAAAEVSVDNYTETETERKLPKPKKHSMLKIIAVAACFFLVIGLGSTAIIFSKLYKSEYMKADFIPRDSNYLTNCEKPSNENYDINPNNTSYGNMSNTMFEDKPSSDVIVEAFVENKIIKTSDENTSTFSIDVDTASYVNFRKTISNMTLADFQNYNYKIRTEEAINYFDYNYDKPTGDCPVAVTTTVGDCSWNNGAKLAVITLAGKEINASEQAGSNIVFLVDVSGSMGDPLKLPLLKESLTMAIEKLSEKDTISIVTYASGVNTVLTGAHGNEKDKIINALNNLQSGGSTAGASGLDLAYSVAQDYFIEGGNNRIIIATDGDFNVGPSSIEEMKNIVTEKRKSGIFLTVLGFGVTYQGGDNRLETLADNGNGGYYAIDSLNEGEKILCDQFTGTLYTVATDVKLQVAFNQDCVESYRLIGYENRMLSNEDFENDAVDAGDLGAGQTVTAIYEIVLLDGADENLFSVDVRYKLPNTDNSQLYEHKAQISDSLNDDFYFVSAVAEACLVINQSQYKGSASLEHAYALASDYANNNSSRKEFTEILNKIK